MTLDIVLLTKYIIVKIKKQSKYDCFFYYSNLAPQLVQCLFDGSFFCPQ